MSDTWLWMSAGDLGRGIERGEIDALALTQHYLAAAESHELSDRIYARLTVDRALAEAQAAKLRAEAGQRRGPLDGVPVSWKDLYDSARVATEAGSALLKDRTPEADCTVLSRATAAGLVCLGKTHMSELAFSGLGYNPVTATPPCINDEEAVPGGSSSGAATSVAYGLAAAGIGSDTGGSVRVPAAWNDLVGLKTTSGLIPLDGVVPLCPSLDTVGPIARTVEDAALLLGVLADIDMPELTPTSLSGAKLAVLETMAFDGIEETTAAAFEETRRQLEAAGAEVQTLQAQCVSDAMALAGMLYTAEAYALWEDQIEAQPDLMFDRVRERFRAGRNHAATDYIRGVRELHRLREGWRDASEGFDAVLLPVSPIQPPKLDRLIADEAYFVEQNLLALRNTRIGNLLGLPGLSLPTGTPSVGIMVMTGPMQEAALLRLGAAIESVLS